MRALELLYHLGALDTEFNLTSLGMVMAQFPLDPQVSGSILILSAHPGPQRFNAGVPHHSSRSF